MSTPALRTPPLSWAYQAASGALEGLSWVSDRLDPDDPGLQEDTSTATFVGAPVARHLPPPMVEAANEAAARGEPTALHGLAALLARPAWLTATRSLFWTSHTPVPALLTGLVEAFGVDAETHAGRAEHLLNLRARLPRWYPHRGRLRATLDLLRATLDAVPGVAEATLDEGETFTCRGAAWWARHGPPAGPLRIEDGVVRLPAGEAPAARPEDVTIRAHDDLGRTPRAVLRLLPAWATVRLAAPRET